MTHNRKPDVLPVEGASIAEALAHLDTICDLMPTWRVAEKNSRGTVALAAIRSALYRAAAEGEAHRWVPCSERMPAPGERVSFVALGQLCIGDYRPDRDSQVWDDLLAVDMCGDCDHYSEEQVTHWQPLPAPPKGSTL